MTNSSANYRKRASQGPRSVDGFIAPQANIQNRTPIIKLPPPVNRPSVPVVRPGIRSQRPGQPAINIPPPAPQTGPSLLNTNLAPPHYKQTFEPPKKFRKKLTRKRIIVRSLLVILALVLITGGWVGWKALHDVDKIFHGNVISDAHALFSSNTLKGESQGRVNILLAGDSSDDPGHQGADLTDSIMVISLDTKNNTGFLLSIPRDLWVDIPSMGHQKINAANTATNFNEAGYPKGGMGQLEQIVEQDLGIPIDYYGLIDYGAFKDAVDAVGGITINIQSPDPRGLYDPNTKLKLPNGEDSLNGQEALNLARARGDGYGSYGFPQSDFDRTQHQRQMLVALGQKAETAGVIANPLKIGQLFDALGNNVQTDLKLSDAISMVQLTKSIKSSNIQSLAISDSGSNPLLTSYTSPNGEDALIPVAGLDDFDAIQQYYKQLTSSNPIVKESANVVIMNGSTVDGLAAKEQTALDNKGFNVTNVADTNNTYAASTIVDLSNNQDPNTKQSLEKLFPGSTVTTYTSSSTEAAEAIPYKTAPYNAAFVVILGTNWANTQQP